jgi:FG-GAP-like repeat
LATADLGNGHLDIITANAGSNDLSVLFGDGHGFFVASPNLTVGDYPTSVAVADLGNGHLDIVVCNGNSNTVTVLLGDGRGSFPTHKEFPVGSQPSGIAVADVNGDGFPDIVTANYKGNDVSVLLGNGSGFFVPTGLFVPIIPVHLVEAVFLEMQSAPTFLPQLLSLSQPSSVALAALTSVTTSGSGQTQSSGQEEPPFEPLLPSLGQPQPVVPTEQDILGNMDIASLLRTWSRPQTNLVPQPNSVGVVATLVPGDPYQEAARKREAGPDIDVRLKMISPVENTLLGPPPSPAKATPARSSNQDRKQRSDRGFDEPLPAEGGLRAKPVAVPATLPKKEEGDKARNYFLCLPLLLSVLGQVIRGPHGYAESGARGSGVREFRVIETMRRTVLGTLSFLDECLVPRRE